MWHGIYADSSLQLPIQSLMQTKTRLFFRRLIARHTGGCEKVLIEKDLLANDKASKLSMASAF